MGQLIDLSLEDEVALGCRTNSYPPALTALTQKTAEQCTAYWKQQFIGLDSSRFPSTSNSAYQPRAEETYDDLMRNVTLAKDGISGSSLIRAAWATLLSWHSASSDVVFGVMMADGPKDRSKNAAFPLRTIVDENMTVGDLLRQIQHQTIEMIPFEQTGLRHIQASSEEALEGCKFQTLLVYQSGAVWDFDTNFADTYAITAVYQAGDDSLRLHWKFDSNLISKCEMKRLSHQLEVVLQQLSQAQATTTKMKDLQVTSDHDLSLIWKWNAEVPESVDMCVHQVFAQRVWDDSAAPAVCAWDGDLTYGQLDKFSTQLSYLLLSRGVGRGEIVPLLFEKSMWMPVAILAVMKSGGTSVMMDVSQPRERLQTVMLQASPKLILCSESQQWLAGNISDAPTFAVSETSLKSQQRGAAMPITPPSPIPSSSPLFIIYTSGSTGVPKGAIVTHGNFCSSMKLHQETLGFTAASRVFDFSSYAFDLAWGNVLHTLTSGGCLCIPSEQDRSSAAAIVHAVSELRANYLHTTPTVGRMLDPSALPGLRTVILSGEALKRTDVTRWSSSDVLLINTYGPSECTIQCVAEVIDLSSEKETDPNIGRGLSAVTWVVRPDKTALAAVGTIGELWIEGPLVGAGYLNDLEKTEAVFIDDPTWLLHGSPASQIPGRRGRLYRTGDLVRYDAEGSLVFIGRQDSQVKIRGQRVELGDIEHHVRRLMPPEVEQVVAEVFTAKGAETPTLGLFFTMLNVKEEELEKKAAPLITNLQEELVKRVAAYMVPTAFLPLTRLPMTATGKTNRKGLRAIGSSMEKHDLLARSKPVTKWVAPSTETERMLQSMWASTLSLELNKIGRDDSFLRLGGDSILAMKFSAAAREKGIFLTVRDIFKQPKLRHLAELVDLKEPAWTPEEVTGPLSLLVAGTDKDYARRSVADLCSSDVADVEDIFPCTPLQEGLLAMTAKGGGKYISRSLVEVFPGVRDVSLREAWERVSAAAPILRTRIVDLKGQGLVQVVLRQSLPWQASDSLQEYRLKEQGSGSQSGMGLGTELTRFGVVHDKPNGKKYLCWTQHHAVYDGWSLQLLQNAVEQAYFGVEVKPMTDLRSLLQYLAQSNTEKDRAFWRRQFDGLEALQFPALPTPTYEPTVDKAIETSIANIQWPVGEVTASTIIRAAWAILLSWQTASPDTVFGTVVLGRQAPIPGIESLAGPTIATVPVRVVVNNEATVTEFLEQVQDQSTEMILHEQTGLQNIRRMTQEAHRACQFQSLLVVQPVTGSSKQSKILKKVLHDEDNSLVYNEGSERRAMEAFNTYALTLECQLDGSDVHTSLQFDSHVISEQDAAGISQRLGHVIHQLCRADLSSTKLRDLSMADELDLGTIWTWNATVADVVNKCVHDLITERAHADPNATAISAWDGELTYGEFDSLSTMLAYELVNAGVKVGTIVPLCFQKSMWVPVSALAVMKAGGASVKMDSTQPEERLRSIVQQTGSHIILSGTATKQLASSISGKPAFVVCKETLDSMRLNMAAEGSLRAELPVVKPTDLLYVVFTSGSTGTPKGAMMTHSNFASGLQHQRQAMCMQKTSRVADFSSYAFDVTWSNSLGAFTAGGCLCIPSEEDRKHDLVGYVNRCRANYLDLTPSVAAALDLQSIPGLEVLVLGGELIELDKFQHLQNLRSLLITYGPAECTITSTVVDARKQHVPSASIGTASGCTTWVVDPEKDTLTPIGLIGELVLEGPLIGSGYLNNPDQTAASFIHDPKWLGRGGAGVPGRRGRLYKTGDLVRYHSDGSLIFIGRKDSQVKIRGQRVDLAEVEYHVRKLLPTAVPFQVVAEVITPKATKSPTLVLFFTTPTAASVEDMKKVFSPIMAELERQLAMKLPVFMLPSAYVPIANVPVSATGKTERKLIRQNGARLNLKEASVPSTTRRGEYIEPSTEIEKQLQLLWSAVLGIDATDISADDSFLALGGDSISAMRLVSVARHSHVSVTVAQVLKSTRLNELAKVIEQQQNDEEEPREETVQPLTLLNATVDAEQALREAAELCSVDVAVIDDVFPCTALQEGLMAMTARNVGDYIQRSLLELKPEVDIGQFKSAWEAVFATVPILRTRIVTLPGQGAVQVVLRTALAWKHSISTDDYQRQEKEDEYQQRSMSLGTPLATFGIIDDADNNKRYFALTLQHATYDGWSLRLMYDVFEQAYRQQEMEALIPLQSFVKYTMSQSSDRAAAFWTKQFADLDPTQFPAVPLKYQVRADKSLDRSFKSLSWSAGEVTTASVLRAAWATLISWYTASADTVFGTVSLGRQAPVPGIEKLAAPTFATVPVCLVVDGDLSVSKFLRGVQTQATEMMQFEQTGIQNISRMTEDARRGCEFQTLLVIQNSETSGEAPMRSAAFLNDITKDDHDAFSTYAVNLTCEVRGPCISVRVSFDSNVISSQRVGKLMDQFGHILRQFCQPEAALTGVLMRDLSMASEQDMSTIWNWNASVPETANGCIHHIFSKRVHENPSAPAVCAWDGELTYRQLGDLSSKLAQYLMSAGVQPGCIVPMYFEKSVWVPVAILAIMKAGGAGVTLDATLPTERLRGIVSQLSPVLVLNSIACQGLVSKVTSAATFTVGEVALKNLQAQLGWPFPDVDPGSPAYIVFTSGSTGLPKGAIVTHRNFCSSAKHHQGPLGLDRSSRIYEYTSYAFDVAWSNMLHSITLGACLCIPSEEDRITDIAGSISRLRATFVHITPTVANILDPLALPTVEKFLFTGEALKRGDVMRWSSRSDIKYYNTYGPAECTVTSAIEIVSPCDDNEPSIGTAHGVLPWIVKPDGNGLAAIGTPGELWLEGPTVGGGYLNNQEKTSAAFVEDPEWLLRGGGGLPGRRGRLYRTGDIVRYNADGSLFYFGRKDTQVKLRGQRVELGEVDNNIRPLMPSEVTQVVSAVITPKTTMTPTLAVFFTLAGKMSAEDLEARVAPMIISLKANLVKRVPPYMVPTAYIPLEELPMTASGKTDRRALGELGRAFMPASFTELSQGTFANSALTEDEASLRAIWADILHVEGASIGPQHSFSGLGGDSIRTMSLAMAIRKQWGLHVQISRLVGSQDTLCKMAKLIKDLQKGQGMAKPSALDLGGELEALTDQLRVPLRMPSRVFLTGSTGFLGTQILRHILEEKTFDRVALLVRKGHGSSGLDRVREAAKEAGWWDESLAGAIEIWDGDLGADRLGLGSAEWSSLCGVESPSGVVDAIIHNGAVVHWSTAYEQLKAANVGSTLQLLQAALHSKFMKKFVFVSGGMSSRDWLDPKRDMAAEATGYDQSKYLSEKLVSAAAAERTDQPGMFSTVKPGLIIGDSEFGVANPDDFLWRIVTSAIRLQARPIESTQSWLPVADVAAISGIILRHATADDVDPFLELGQGMWVDSFWSVIEDELQQPLRPVSWETWMALAEEDIAKEHEAHPLWPVQQFLGALGGESDPSANNECGAQIDQAIRQNVSYLKRMGLAGADGATWQQGVAKVSMRSRRP